jgi:hypothetical protein
MTLALQLSNQPMTLCRLKYTLLHIVNDPKLHQSRIIGKWNNIIRGKFILYKIWFLICKIEGLYDVGL